jgi:hypothetical protein
MAAREVLRVQPATETLLETTDAAAHRLQAGRLPHSIANDIDLGDRGVGRSPGTPPAAGTPGVAASFVRFSRPAA